MTARRASSWYDPSPLLSRVAGSVARGAAAIDAAGFGLLAYQGCCCCRSASPMSELTVRHHTGTVLIDF